MKLLDLHLLAYGPFTDHHLDLREGHEGLHMIFGPNEAGKSSALRALRALLYGVPERTQDDFQHGKTELRVGGVLRGADGGELHCYRRKGRKNTLLDAKGETIGENALQPFLGGVEQSLFEQLFGIDHEALVSGGQELLVERGREAEALFGTGLGSTAVHGLLKSLDQEAQSLFAPRAVKPSINAGLSRLSEIESQQREVSLSARQWDEARKSLETATGRLSEIDTQLACAERRRSTLERIRRSSPALARRRHILEKLAALGDVAVLEENFGQRREAALSKKRLAAEGRSKTRSRLEGLRRDASGLEASRELLAEADAIDELRDRLGGYQKAARDRPGLVARRTTLMELVRQRFAEIRRELSLDSVETLRPLLALRRRTAELGGRREALEAAVKRAREGREGTAGKLAKRRDELGLLPPPLLYEGLEHAVSEARRAGDLDSAIAEANAELVRHQGACQRDLESLGLWAGTLSELTRVPLPGEQTLQRFAEDFNAVEEKKRRLKDSIAEAQKEQRRAEEALLALRLAGEVPTETDLQNARDRREQGWQLLKRKWVGGEDVAAESQSYAAGQPLPDAFEKEIAGADEIADRLRRESQRVLAQAAAQAKLEDCRIRAKDGEGKLRAVAEGYSMLQQSWEDAWKATGIAPSSPREMSAWIVKASLLREKVAGGDELERKADALQRRRETQRGNLRSALEGCREPQSEIAEQSELRPLLVHAESRLRCFEQTASRRAVLEEAVAELEDAQRKSEGELASAEVELTAWSRDWAGLGQELGYGEQATPGEVSDYLQAIADGLKLVDEAKELQLRVDGIDQEAKEFERDVDAAMARLAPDLADRAAAEAIRQLNARLTDQREAKNRLDVLDKQVRKAEAEIREADGEIKAADDVLDELCRQAGCDSPNELEAIERRCLEHRDLSKQLREVEKELVEGGDGLSVEALETEMAQVDRDTVLAELAALGQRIDQELRPERERLFERKLSADRELHSMAGTDEASALAEQAQQTLSEIRGYAEKYVRLKLAARLLRDEIEGFRRKHRDPILTGASVFFRKLTCGSLARIDTDFDESDQPVLVGVRPNGERLRVEAMSTGTRDQLYLALRLATLDHYVETSEALPFIVDDILIQFDDERSQATLAALADFSAKAQVILFTHHERVVAEAMGLDNAAGRVFVHKLAQAAV